MNNLWKDFDSVSAKQWKQKIQVDLKGADYNDTLVWQSLEGINVKPFYHQDDFENSFNPIPGQPSNWNIAQSIYVDDEVIVNGIALNAIDKGAEAIIIIAEELFDIPAVFKNFPFDKVAIYCKFSFLSQEFYNELIAFFSEKKATIYYGIDLIGNLTKDGNWFHSLEKDHQILENLVQNSSVINSIGVNTATYQNAGANCVQQLAYGIAHANEYLNHFSETNKEINFTFTVSVGSNYFFEIAKIRALRLLHATIADLYKCNVNCHILAVPSKRNKTLYDYNVNMLRTTTECMSAVLGGADTVANLPYDAIYHKSNKFGERISRNQLLILKAESYFDTVSNASDGSYYIEALTQELAEKALTLFKDIERNGGFLSQLKEGTIQKKIKESAQKEQSLFDEGKLKLLGTNLQPNLEDKMKENLELYPFVKTKPRKTLLEPIIEKRLSENLEKERLENEK
ncbi:methylmalonyl-CoA mutase subunit beta [Patiriisocius hiemis]|uniref:Methylmalonyl-CoA mutase subunit beta n=1 Tax=Patiriisocius hiemis TaxID=3075604 RepID=A0ABU2Y9G4_9FLAO|nr:methylmalonyl-CoA mutase subunit beta [Constantimarinum sp. W242]MDT0554460.1 methylmalonyl-CoA mutase subunit beta [Constantimarinum sp. W242]